MVTIFPFSDEWMSHSHVKALFSATRWNQYVENWPVALAALRHLWEKGRVSELKSPYYEQFDKPGKNLKII